MFKHIFKEFPAFEELIGDNGYALTLHIIGGTLIAITFIFIGFICIYPPITDPTKTRKSLLITKMFGFFLISCGLSRGLDTVAIWHNYAILTGYIKVLTGLLALLTIVYIPAVIKDAMKDRNLDNVTEKLQETNQRLGEVQQISETLDKNMARK
jgi:hypothetical protein